MLYLSYGYLKIGVDIMSYGFIEPLEEKPKVEKKARKVSIAELILNEFMESRAKYARVSFDKLKDSYKSPAFASRAIGRVSKRQVSSLRQQSYR